MRRANPRSRFAFRDPQSDVSAAHARESCETAPAPHETGCIAGVRRNMVLVEAVDGLSQRLAVCFNDPGLSDIEVETEGGGKFYCHKVVLAANSPVFSSMFRSNMKEAAEGKVVVKQVTPNAVEWLLRACYSGKGELTDDVVVPVMVAAKMYQIGWILSACRRYLKDNMKLDNCCRIFDQLLGVANSGLQGKWASFIHGNIASISKQSDFLSLSCNALESLVKLQTNHDLFQALLQWLNQDYHSRSASFGQLLAELDLFELRRDDLVELMTLGLVEESSELHAEISELLGEGSVSRHLPPSETVRAKKSAAPLPQFSSSARWGCI